MEVPAIETVHLEYPSPRNPLGVKGIGEGGAISPPAAIANAVEDALAPFGVRVTRAPLGPSRVLGLIAEGAARLAGRGGRREARPFEYHAARSADEAVERAGAPRRRRQGAGRRPEPRAHAGPPARAPGACSSTSTARAELDYLREADGVLASARSCASARSSAGRPARCPSSPRRCGWSGTRRSGIAARRSAISSTAIPPPSCPRCCSVSTARSSRRRPRGRALIAAGELYLAPLTTSLAADEISPRRASRCRPPARAGASPRSRAATGTSRSPVAAALLGRDGDGRVSRRATGVLRCRDRLRCAAARGEGAAARLRADAGAVAARRRAPAAAALSPDGDIHATRRLPPPGRRGAGRAHADRRRSSGAEGRRERARRCASSSTAWSARGRRGAAHLAGRLPARRARPHRHARGLRARRVRRVHRAARRASRCAAASCSRCRRRGAAHHDRGPGARRARAALEITGALHPIQQAFRDKHGLQCGFCTPGILLTAEALLRENPSPSHDEIRETLAGNLCRCTGYHFIVEAIAEAARVMRRAQ